jgi:hypothetical protein
MGFRLTLIFLQSEEPKSDEEILKKLGLTNLEKGKTVNFYDTSKQYERVFIGTKGNCKILSNGKLAYQALEEENPFLSLENTEICAIIWDETSAVFGFSLIKNGKTIRKMLVIDSEIECDFGEIIPEELAMKGEEIFTLEEKEEIIEEEGEEGFNEKVKAEKISRIANILAKRYISASLVSLQERIELSEYTPK